MECRWLLLRVTFFSFGRISIFLIAFPLSFFLSLSPSIFCSRQIDLKHKNQLNNSDNMVKIGIDLREYYPSVEWDILGVPAERHEKYYPCCAEPYPGK